MHWPGGFEWVVIGIIGVLIFGKRLPEVGKSVGQMIVNFKKGMREAQDEINNAGEVPPSKQLPAQTAYKFDPYTGKPLEEKKPEPEQRAMKFDPYTGQPLSQ